MSPTFRPSLLEVQFPIARLSLEAFIERDAKGGKILASLGKWWGGKPLVLTRAILLGALFEASENPEDWPRDLDIFYRLMTLDPAGMWRRCEQSLPAALCYPHARPEEKIAFKSPGQWSGKRDDDVRAAKTAVAKRYFYSLSYEGQRDYCCRVEQIEGPPPESWKEINAYCGTSAQSLSEWVAQMSQRRYGHTLRVGDAFSGSGSIPFEAAELGCEVYASDLNPAACLLTWGALHLVAGPTARHKAVLKAQEQLYRELSDWAKLQETSAEGWRAEAFLYCVEITVPEWDGWRIPLSGSWEIAPKMKTWVELVPDPARKAFDFRVQSGGPGFATAAQGTKQDADVVCPQVLWDLLHQQNKTANATRSIPLNTLLQNHGGLRRWENADILPRRDDFYGERLYCIRWRRDIPLDKDKLEPLQHPELVYREPLPADLECEERIAGIVSQQLHSWQQLGCIPDWRIEDGAKTNELIRTRGWTHWHHLFTPRQLWMAAETSARISSYSCEVRPALVLSLGKMLDVNSKLCRWLQTQGGGIGGTKSTFYNQALNTFYNFAARGFGTLDKQISPPHGNLDLNNNSQSLLRDARTVEQECDIWITDPPYADAVNYEELSEFFLAWYKPHLRACFPEWYTDARREAAVKGDDAPFRVAMADCYRRLADKMPDNGLQVLMFTHKDTDVWEDLAMIMWSAGLQVKQVWSVATETPGAGIRVGNYVQATYNMVLRKRPAQAPMGFVELVIPQIRRRVEEVILHMRDSQLAGAGSCGYTDTDYLLAAQAVAAEVVTGFSSIEGIDLDEELRTPNRQRGNSLLRDMMNQAKRSATDFLVPPALASQLKRSPDGGNAYQFWRSLAAEEKFLLKSLEIEAGGVFRIGAFQDLGRAYGVSDYAQLLGPVKANETRSRLPTEFPRPDLTRWEEIPPNERGLFAHSVTRQLYHALKLMSEGAEVERVVKHLVDTTNFWQDRHGRHLILLGYLHQVTESLPDWQGLKATLQSLRLAVEHARA